MVKSNPKNTFLGICQKKNCLGLAGADQMGTQLIFAIHVADEPVQGQAFSTQNSWLWLGLTLEGCHTLKDERWPLSGSARQRMNIDQSKVQPLQIAEFCSLLDSRPTSSDAVDELWSGRFWARPRMQWESRLRRAKRRWGCPRLYKVQHIVQELVRALLQESVLRMTENALSTAQHGHQSRSFLWAKPTNDVEIRSQHAYRRTLAFINLPILKNSPCPNETYCGWVSTRASRAVIPTSWDPYIAVSGSASPGRGWKHLPLLVAVLKEWMRLFGCYISLSVHLVSVSMFWA